MKLILSLFFTVWAAVTIAAQTPDIARTFETNKAKYAREHLVMGEDVSSGFDYLFYKSGNKIVKIRSIWSASHSNELRIEDFYYSGDSPLLIQKFTGTKRQLSSLKRGVNVALSKKEEMQFTDSKLTTWIKNGRPVFNTDPKWAETEKAEFEHAKSQLESYGFLKDN